MYHWLALPIDAGWTKDLCGYFASSMVLCTFSVRSMRLLRWLGIASNLSFIAYAIIAGAPPILILHSLLLPMNIYRLMQIERERRHLRHRLEGGSLYVTARSMHHDMPNRSTLRFAH